MSQVAGLTSQPQPCTHVFTGTLLSSSMSHFIICKMEILILPTCVRSVASVCLLFVSLWTVAPGSSDHGILQTRTLEWVAMPSSRGSSRPRDQIHISYVSCIGNRVLYHEHHLGSPIFLIGLKKWVHACKHLEQCLEHKNSQYMWAITTAMIYYYIPLH